MRFLALNTAGSNLEVLVENNGKKIYLVEDNFRKTSERVMPMIESALESAGVELDSLDALCACVGPGSFTGIRIGVSIVRAFSQVREIPVFAVNQSEVVAYNMLADAKNSEYIVSVIDAKNGFFYLAVYSSLDMQQIMPPKCVTESQLKEFLSMIDEPYILAADTDAASLLGIEAKGSGGFEKAAVAAAKKGGFFGYENLTPLYVRKSQAEIFADGIDKNS